MNVLIFNGAPDIDPNATSFQISNYLEKELTSQGVGVQTFNISEAGIPLFDFRLTETPESVTAMNQAFREADAHIWLTPLYHGSMTGVMKNCLDWLELSSKSTPPYLTDKKVGLVCWADGVQAVQGINALDTVAKALRAWTLPYNVPIQRNQLYDDQKNIKPEFQTRFKLLIQVLLSKPN